MLANDGIIYDPQLDNDPEDSHTVKDNLRNFTQCQIRDGFAENFFLDEIEHLTSTIE